MLAQTVQWLTPSDGCQRCNEKHVHSLPHQIPRDWPGPRIRAVAGGRGLGKGVSLINWVIAMIATFPEDDGALVSVTTSDIKNTLLEGEGGLLTRTPPELWDSIDRKDWVLTTVFGGRIHCVSSSAINRVRGRNLRWCGGDEFSIWMGAHLPYDHGDAPLPTIEGALRVGESQHLMLTGTARNVQIVRDLRDLSKHDPTISFEQYSTLLNTHLPESYRKRAQQAMNTFSGRQEYGAEILDDIVGAMATWDLLTAVQVPSQAQFRHKELSNVTVSVDPSGKGEATRDTTGIVVGAISSSHGAVIVDDASTTAPAEQWPELAAEVCRRWGATTLLVESNQAAGLTMRAARAALANAGVTACAVKDVWAGKVEIKGQDFGSKWARAERVSGALGWLDGNGDLQDSVLKIAVGLPDLREEFATTTTESVKRISPGRVDASYHLLRHLIPDFEKDVAPGGYAVPAKAAAEARERSSLNGFSAGSSQMTARRRAAAVGAKVYSPSRR